jgi:hypothetical protein
MRTLFLIISFTLLCCSDSIAQKIKTLEAVQQDRSGGIAGRRGSNYHFTIQFSGTKAAILPDTIWVGADGIALGEKGKSRHNNYSIKKKGKITTILIDVQTSKDDYTDRYPTNIKDDPRGKRPMPPKYKGVALLAYKLNGRTQRYTIEKILDRPVPINYP